jgi:hypothetical protein
MIKKTITEMGHSNDPQVVGGKATVPIEFVDISQRLLDTLFKLRQDVKNGMIGQPQGNSVAQGQVKASRHSRHPALRPKTADRRGPDPIPARPSWLSFIQSV